MRQLKRALSSFSTFLLPDPWCPTDGHTVWHCHLVVRMLKGQDDRLPMAYLSPPILLLCLMSFLLALRSKTMSGEV